MTTNQPTPTPDLDRLLSAFYQSELPNPWPRLRCPRPPAPLTASAASATPTRKRSANPMRQSQFALAASVVMLLGSCWYLSGLPLTNLAPSSAPNFEAVDPFDLSADQGILSRQFRPSSVRQPAGEPFAPPVDPLNLDKLGGATGLPLGKGKGQ